MRCCTNAPWLTQSNPHDFTLNYISNHSLELTLYTFHFHENWLVTCFSRSLGFGWSSQQHSFLPSLAQNSPHPARVNWCHLHIKKKNLPLPSLLNQISWQQGIKYLTPPGNRTKCSAVGAHFHNQHPTNYCCVPNFTVYLIRLAQSRTDPGYNPLPSCCTRHFSLPHHASRFSQINVHNTNHRKQPIFLSPLPGCLIPTWSWDSFHLSMA